MKVDTLTGPNLSMQVALLEKKPNPVITRNHFTTELTCYIDSFYVEDGVIEFHFDNPATFQPIAEREGISCTVTIGEDGKPAFWSAMTLTKITQDNTKYQRIIKAHGDTEAEARMRCYVKSYLGEDTKGE